MEAVRQKKMIKLKTKTRKFRKVNLKLFRDNAPLLSVLQWGIRQSIEELTEVPMPPIFMNEDYKAHWKIKKVNYHFNKQGQPSQFKFKEYCPLVFKKLRQLFNYSDERFLSLLTKARSSGDASGLNAMAHLGFNLGLNQHNQPGNINTNSSGNPDASDDEFVGAADLANLPNLPNFPTQMPNIGFGSSFNDTESKINADDENMYPKLPSLYYSNDYALIVKFISSDNVAEMHNFLPKYYRHMVERGADNSILPRYLALYRLSHSSSNDDNDISEARHGKDTYVVIMENMFSKHLKIHKQYDLKGSTVGRSASTKEKDRGVLFDKDFINDNEQIILDTNDRKSFLEKLKADVEFLAESKIISYSLLVGIHDTTKPQDNTNLRDQHSPDERDPNSDKGYESPDNQIIAAGDRIGDAAIDPISSQTSEVDNLNEKGENVSNKTAQEIEGDGVNPVLGQDSDQGKGREEKVASSDNSPADGREDNKPPDFKQAVVAPTNIAATVSNNVESNYEITSLNKDFIYYMGLIDCMTAYDTEKKVAHAVKHAKHGSTKAISTVKPQKYKDRFMEFVETRVVLGPDGETQL